MNLLVCTKLMVTNCKCNWKTPFTSIYLVVGPATVNALRPLRIFCTCPICSQIASITHLKNMIEAFRLEAMVVDVQLQGSSLYNPPVAIHKANAP
uniref:Uncharacterized protein n=1 Tax=Pararge aegeria TaxID=116150 RepID=S4PCR4_9NEOP